MANKRTLKHSINLVCGDLFAECVAARLYGNRGDDCEAIIYSILKMQGDFICRISHPEPGLKQKAYYKTIISDFNKQASELIDQIVNLG